MSTNLPDNRIKKVKLPNNSEYEIIPSRLQSSGFEASLPVLTEDSVIPVLNSDGKLDSSVLPALAISDTFVVASQAAMLALTAEVGDIAVRTDLNKSFILKTAGASTLSHWQELLTPTDAVTSVNGKTGVVTLNATDVNALPSDYSPEIKTLNTNNTAAQTASSSEEIKGTGTINLHKVSKTGSYNDLLDKPSFTDTNQKVKVGNVTFGNNDVVEFVAGNNTTIIGDASAKTITIDATNTIVDQDLLAIGFTPVEGVYYRHLGNNSTAGAKDPLIINTTPTTIYFNTNKSVDNTVALIEAARQNMAGADGEGVSFYTFISTETNPDHSRPGANTLLLYYIWHPEIIAEVVTDGSTDPVYYLVGLTSSGLVPIFSNAPLISEFYSPIKGWNTNSFEYGVEIKYLQGTDCLDIIAGSTNNFGTIDLTNSSIYHYINNEYLAIDTPSLARVAKTGEYHDLLNTPKISITSENLASETFTPKIGNYYKASLSSDSSSISLPIHNGSVYAVGDKIHVDTTKSEEFGKYVAELLSGQLVSGDFRILAGTSLSYPPPSGSKLAITALLYVQNDIKYYEVFVGSDVSTSSIIYINSSDGTLPQEAIAAGLVIGFNNLDSNNDFTISSTGSQNAPWTITKVRDSIVSETFRLGQQTLYNNKIYYYDGVYKEIPLKTDFSNVAFSGDYNDLINTPAAGDNYYHIPEYSTGMKIGTGYGVNDMYVPTGTTSGTVALGNHTHAYADLTNRPAVLDSIKDQSSGIGLLKLTNGVASIDNSEYALTSQLPTALADLSDDATHRVVTDTEKTSWSGKQAGSTVLTSIAGQSSGTGLLKLTNGTASLDTTSYGTYSKPSGGIPDSDIANASNWVTLNTSQTISGDKAFSGSFKRNSSTIDVDASSVTNNAYCFTDYYDKDNARVGLIGVRQYSSSGDYGCYMQIANTESLNFIMNTSGNNRRFFPGNSNQVSLGWNDKRWKSIYAGTDGIKSNGDMICDGSYLAARNDTAWNGFSINNKGNNGTTYHMGMTNGSSRYDIGCYKMNLKRNGTTSDDTVDWISALSTCCEANNTNIRTRLETRQATTDGGTTYKTTQLDLLASNSYNWITANCNDVRPAETDTTDLGTSSKQWNNIYGKTLYENNTSLQNKYKRFVTFKTGSDTQSLSSYWFPLWKQTGLSGQYTDFHYLIYIGNWYARNTIGDGFLEFGIRQDDTTGDNTQAYLRVTGGTLKPEKFKLIKRTDTKLYELWVNTSEVWHTCTGVLLKSSSRNVEYNYAAWGAFNNSLYSAVQTPPTGTTILCQATNKHYTSYECAYNAASIGAECGLYAQDANNTDIGKIRWGKDGTNWNAMFLSAKDANSYKELEFVRYSGSGNWYFDPITENDNVKVDLGQNNTNRRWNNVYCNNVYAASDRRLKENIKLAEIDYSKVVENLQIKEFNFINDEEKKVVVGAIAQELKEILPEKYQASLVSGSEDTSYSINEGKLLYIAIGALKEEQAKVKSLEERLEKVEKLLEK